jgi:hypothetical protein
METITVEFEGGKNVTYRKLENGTYYHAETPQAVIDVLENARFKHERVILDYGDAETGKSWGEDCDIIGYVGRSTGSVAVPLLVHNSRSFCGASILDHCIVAIMASQGKRVLYKHPSYIPYWQQ